MSNVQTPKAIDSAIAKRFLQDPDSFNLSKATSITDEAAELLSKHEGSFLFLNGLTEISNAAAESLSKHQGDLYLHGLTELSDAAAESLSKHQEYLSLNGLTELSDSAAESLSKHQGGLRLEGLTQLSDAAAESLSTHQGGLRLSGLETISAQGAKFLLNAKGKVSTYLDLEAIANFDDDDDDHKYDDEDQGDSENFDRNDLESAYAAAANDDEFIVHIDFDYCEVNYSGYQILSKAELGKLIAGLRSGAQVGAHNMPKHWEEDFDIGLLDGSFSIHSADPEYVAAMRLVFGESVGDTGYFYEVMEAAPKVIDLALAREFLESDVDLSEMTSITDEAAEVLSTHEGDLFLDGLTEISDVTAESLSKLEGLYLNGLTVVSNSVASSLAKQQGSLELNGLTVLTDSVAEVFSKHCGYLALNGIFDLSDTAARFLSTKLGDLSLNGLSGLSAHAAANLAKHGNGKLPVNDIIIRAANETGVPGTSINSILKKVFGSLADFSKLTDVAPIAGAGEDRKLVSLLAKESNLTEEDIDELLKALTEVAEFCLRENLRDSLNLNGLAELSDVAAESLAKHEGKLGLNGLTELSDAAAESLSRVQGGLSLDGLETISAQGAKFLLNAKGEVSTGLDLEAIASGDYEKDDEDYDDEDEDYDDDYDD
jgi:hypothetical protein